MMATRTTNQTHNSLAVKYFKIADSLGLTAATFRLGRIIEHGSLGMEANPSEAFKYYTKAAEKNNVESMLELSRLCKDGIPGYLNAHPVMAHTWCIKASERGNEVAEYLMG
jgi:TPR repeat protein